ncbi:AMP-binding protein [Cohnella sp. WQ 127256]|uniref:AMP-binding protein n=1 Tax=Cohnella sp. WQ 127256 TaxID=2938790 RepID=UPI00211813A7|nr:AMP-binding protein [Cohnella sp. WQ 127256]
MSTLAVLYKIKLLSPVGLVRFLHAVWKYGINVMALLSFAAKTYRNEVAIVDEHETLSYSQLQSQSEKLAFLLQQQYGVRSGYKVGFMCKNHANLVKSIFAASLLGADIYLLNAEMSNSQLDSLLGRYDFHFIVYDGQLSSLIEQSSYSKLKLLSYHDHLPSISSLVASKVEVNLKLQRTSSSKLILLTGGTTGKSKAAAHKPSMFRYVNPFIAMITRLNLLHYRTAYIATPIYHGYGVAVCLLFIAMGKKIVVREGFDAAKACDFIHKHQVEVVTVVPLMIHKMLEHDAECLTSLTCIASGSAELNPKLVEKTRSKLGDIIYNLYGTSEAGLNMIATPQDLKMAENTIGKKITGVRLKIVDDHKNEVELGKVGQFCIKNKGLRKNSHHAWIEVGDLGYRDHQGYYYLCGRVDDMVVSAGVNVYPIEVEQALIKHPEVEDVAVIGVRDEHFGQRLKAFVLLANHASATQEELLDWLRNRVARFQMPREIIFVENMPYTSLGKHDKKYLRESQSGTL